MAARWKMASGRSAISRAAAPAAARSLAAVTTANVAPAGSSGATMSVNVIRSMARPFNPPSPPSRAVSLRPIMPAAPVMRICISSLDIIPLPRLRGRVREGAKSTAQVAERAPSPTLPRKRGREKGLQRHAAVDQMGLAGDIACLVGRKEERERRDFLRHSKAADGLAVDKILAHR